MNDKVKIYDADETHGNQYRCVGTRVLDRTGPTPLVRFGGRVWEVKRIEGMWVLDSAR